MAYASQAHSKDQRVNLQSIRLQYLCIVQQEEGISKFVPWCLNIIQSLEVGSLSFLLKQLYEDKFRIQAREHLQWFQTWSNLFWYLLEEYPEPVAMKLLFFPILLHQHKYQRKRLQHVVRFRPESIHTPLCDMLSAVQQACAVLIFLCTMLVVTKPSGNKRMRIVFAHSQCYNTGLVLQSTSYI